MRAPFDGFAFAIPDRLAAVRLREAFFRAVRWGDLPTGSQLIEYERCDAETEAE